MRKAELVNVIAAQIDHIRQSLMAKNVEYGHNEEALYNFKRAAKINNTIPEVSLWGFASKHLVSVIDIIVNLQNGELADKKQFDEKIGDLINYLILLKALIYERYEQETTE